MNFFYFLDFPMPPPSFSNFSCSNAFATHTADVTLDPELEPAATLSPGDESDEGWYRASLRAARIELIQYDPRRRAIVNAARGAVIDWGFA